MEQEMLLMTLMMLRQFELKKKVLLMMFLK